VNPIPNQTMNKGASVIRGIDPAIRTKELRTSAANLEYQRRSPTDVPTTVPRLNPTKASEAVRKK
jgi:hypothetical protein